MPKMGDLAAQNNYGAVDWSRMNQPFGELMDPNPKLYDTKAGPIYQADINQAIDVGMGVSGGGLATKGIKAYHSSPHDFERFDLSKIGTGEGAQVYGHGLYFAENPAVSGQGGQYWNQFLSRFPEEERRLAEMLKYNQFDRSKTGAVIQKEIDDYTSRIAPGGVFDKPHMTKAQERTRKYIEELSAERDKFMSGKPVGPRTYEVNIKADPAHMLDWDKPLRDQPHIQDVLADRMIAQLPGKAGIRKLREINEEVDVLGNKSGDILYRNFSRNPREASAVLQEAGIPGIKYLDQGSRGAGTGSSNYVVFDPSIVDIMKKYGIAGAAPTGMGVLAAQDAYRGE